MTKKQIIILGVILGVLVLGIFLKTYLQRQDPGLGSTEGRPVFEFDPAKVEKILISRDPSAPPVQLEKKDGSWQVASLWDAKADPVKVGKLLEKIRSAKGELRASGKDLFGDFGIDDAHAFSIRFLNGKDALVLDLLLGTKPAGAEGYFLRRAGKSEVYLANVDMADLLGIYIPFAEANPSSHYWADLTLLNLHPEKVLSITAEYIIQKSGRVMTLGIQKGKESAPVPWVFIKPEYAKKTVDPEKVLRFIATLNSIQAQNVEDPKGKNYGLEAPVFEMNLQEEGSKAVQASVGPEKDGFCFVRISDRPGVFKLNQHFFEDLDMKDEGLVKEPAKTELPPETSAKLAAAGKVA